MSRNGLAFVSCDGNRFLSDAGGVENPPPAEAAAARAAAVTRARLRGGPSPRFATSEPPSPLARNGTPPSPACSDAGGRRGRGINVHKW